MSYNIKYFVIMQQFELNLSMERADLEFNTEITSLQFLNEMKLYHLSKLYKIIKKYHSRAFLNLLKSTVLKALLKMTTFYQKKQEPLPYSIIINKKDKNEKEQLEWQFINMCAQKIQAVYRGYIKRKYHKIAYKKFQKIETKIQGIVAGWKTRKIMSCVKIRERAHAIKRKLLQSFKQQEVTRSTSNIYSLKKLQYLRKSLKDQINQFISNYRYLYDTGAWVFEPREMFFMKKDIYKPKQQMIKQQLENQHKTTRVQSLRDRTFQSKKDNADNKHIQSREKPLINIDQINNEVQVLSKKQKKQLMNEQIQVTPEDRPIQAKGVYHFDQIQANSIQQNYIMKKSQKSHNDEYQKQQLGQKAKIKAIEKKKLEKRQKYDPRKAIIEQKTKKMLQKQIKALNQNQKQQSQKNLSKRITKEAIITTQAFENKDQQIDKNILNKDTAVLSQKSQIVFENRKTVQISKNSKTTAQPKIDCWANRKTNKKQQPFQNANSYLKIHITKQKLIEPEKNDRQTINNRQKKNRKMQQIMSQLQKAQREQEQMKVESKRNSKALLRGISSHHEIKKTMSYEEIRMQKYQKLISPKRQQNRQRQGHKDIQQIEGVYRNQYQSRLQRLIPKLEYIKAARERQRQENIPILTQSNLILRKKIVQFNPENKFWNMVSRVQRSIKDFDKL